MIRYTLLFAIFHVASAFLAPVALNRNVPGVRSFDAPTETTTLFLAQQRDKSRSGTKRDRLDKLAELEDSRVETDKGFVGLAAGGFVGLLLLLLAVAFASGVLDPVSTGY